MCVRSDFFFRNPDYDGHNKTSIRYTLKRMLHMCADFFLCNCIPLLRASFRGGDLIYSWANLYSDFCVFAQMVTNLHGGGNGFIFFVTARVWKRFLPNHKGIMGFAIP